MPDPITLYHGLRDGTAEGFSFQDIKDHPEGIHLGTLAQARMRAGKRDVLEVRLRLDRVSRIPRVRDQEYTWASLLKRRSRKGDRVLVYLNRYEGLSIDSVEALAKQDTAKLERMPDKAFSRLAHDATDSYVVLDPDLVEIVGLAPPQ